jgi:hypothetical protein
MRLSLQRKVQDLKKLPVIPWFLWPILTSQGLCVRYEPIFEKDNHFVLVAEFKKTSLSKWSLFFDTVDSKKFMNRPFEGVASFVCYWTFLFISFRSFWTWNSFFVSFEYRRKSTNLFNQESEWRTRIIFLGGALRRAPSALKVPWGRVGKYRRSELDFWPCYLRKRRPGKNRASLYAFSEPIPL